MQAERDRDVQQPVPDTIVDNRLDPVWGRAGATPTAPGNRQAGQWTRHSFGVRRYVRSGPSHGCAMVDGPSTPAR